MPVFTTDIDSLLKRLDALRIAISLADIDDINTQSAKLERLTADFGDLDLVMKTAWIIDRIATVSYGDAMVQIELLRNSFKGIAISPNPEVDGLRAEVGVLATQIHTLEVELGDVEKIMYEFEMTQARELGELALKVLTSKRRKAASRAQADATDRQAALEFRNAWQEEEDYKGSYEERMSRPLRHLDDEQLAELKAKFKKIAKLTHPDLVDKRFEKEAVETFQRARQAKDMNDLDAITAILDYLVEGRPFLMRHEILTETESLRTEARHLRGLVGQLAQKVSKIKISDTYQTIIRISDWGQYFSEIRSKMMMDLVVLESA